MPVKEITAKTLLEFLDHALQVAQGGVRWFRGQGCATRTLTPSLMRKAKARDAAEMLQVESRLLTRFRQRSLPFWPEGYPQSPWEHLFAMQHVRIPTRLLDWTENALVAAYFAADHDPARCECKTQACRPTVWVLDPIAFNQANPRFSGYGSSITILTTTEDITDPWRPGAEALVMAPDPIAIYGTHNSARIVAQQGTFTVSGKEATPLEELSLVTNSSDILTKIELDVAATELLNQLEVLGIHRSTVFPDLEGLGVDITKAEIK